MPLVQEPLPPQHSAARKMKTEELVKENEETENATNY